MNGLPRSSKRSDGSPRHLWEVRQQALRPPSTQRQRPNLRHGLVVWPLVASCRSHASMRSRPSAPRDASKRVAGDRLRVTNEGVARGPLRVGRIVAGARAGRRWSLWGACGDDCQRTRTSGLSSIERATCAASSKRQMRIADIRPRKDARLAPKIKALSACQANACPNFAEIGQRMDAEGVRD